MAIVVDLVVMVVVITVISAVVLYGMRQNGASESNSGSVQRDVAWCFRRRCGLGSEIVRECSITARIRSGDVRMWFWVGLVVVVVTGPKME